VAINDPGDVAYVETAQNTPTPAAPFVFLDSLRVLKNGATSPVTVIQSGDSLFGSTVATVGIPAFVPTPRYMNNSGQMAFTYSLTNRSSGIALATPK
jgi:hypothetical protein